MAMDDLTDLTIEELDEDEEKAPVSPLFQRLIIWGVVALIVPGLTLVIFAARRGWSYRSIEVVSANEQEDTLSVSYCNVDGNIGWTEFGDTFMRTGRVALDGFTMYQAMTENAIVHSVYANDYQKLGISGISSFFNQLRPTPIDSE